MRRRERGFTLLEVMIAVGVMTLMMVVAWGAVVQTMNAKRHFERQQDRFREARAALQRIVSDLETAYISGNEDRTQLETRTFFVGDAAGDVNQLRFSSFANQRLYADANESDQTVVSYYAASDRFDRQRTNLIRRTTRRLGTEKPESLPGEADILFSGIGQLRFTYFDVRDNEWKDSWSTQGVEGSAGRLPDRVKVRMTFNDDDGKEVILTTQAKLPLQEVLQFIAN
jgi:general secretion pathway protein J